MKKEDHEDRSLHADLVMAWCLKRSGDRYAWHKGRIYKESFIQQFCIGVIGNLDQCRGDGTSLCGRGKGQCVDDNISKPIEGCFTQKSHVFTIKKPFETARMDGIWVEDSLNVIRYFNIDCGNLTMADRSWLPTIFWEGKRVKLWYEQCGVGGRIYNVLKAQPAK